MGTISSKTRSIEDDYRDIQNLFAAAKMGNWGEVLRILGPPERPLKPYLINLIPENRRWGILQQAVWWNNTEVIKKLLKFKACDKNLRAKEGVSENGDTGGNTAEQIAIRFGYSEASKILASHINLKTDNEIDTFYTGTGTIENEEFGLFRLTIAAYKNTFHPSTIDKTKPLRMLANDIFQHVSNGKNWMIARDSIAQSLYTACETAGNSIAQTKTQNEFFKQIINVYTDEDTQLYTYLNTALRRQRDVGYRPTSNDLALGPYILMFHLLLFCWKILKHEKRKTYRKMKITDEDLEEYQPGTNFTWLSFVSSSVKREYAQIFPSCQTTGDTEVNFIIDNSTASQWQPLNIEEYACYSEQQRVYPAGAKFQIVRRSVRKGITTIRMQLMSGETNS